MSTGTVLRNRQGGVPPTQSRQTGHLCTMFNEHAPLGFRHHLAHVVATHACWTWQFLLEAPSVCLRLPEKKAHGEPRWRGRVRGSRQETPSNALVKAAAHLVEPPYVQSTRPSLSHPNQRRSRPAPRTVPERARRIGVVQEVLRGPRRAAREWARCWRPRGSAWRRATLTKWVRICEDGRSR